MADVNYVGKAEFATHLVTVALTGTLNAGDYLEVSCNGKAIRYTADGADTFTTLIAAFVALWNDNATADEPIYEFTEVAVADAGSDTMTFTHDTPGVPFTFTYTASGFTATPTTTTAATGPYHADNVDNYDIAALPSANDTLYIPEGQSLRYGLTALTALNLAFRIHTSEQIGLAKYRTTEDNAGSYPEYRQRALQIRNGASLETIINGQSSLIVLEGMAQVTLRVVSTGVSQNNEPVVQYDGASASDVLHITQGSLGICYEPGSTGTVASLNVGYSEQEENDSTVWGGYGLTLTTLNQGAGDVTLHTAPTTVNKYGGTLTLNGGTPVTINHYKGTIHYRAGNCTTYRAFRESINNFQGDTRTKTFTNATIYEESEWNDPMATVNFTNTVSVPGGSPTGIKGTFGPGRSTPVAFGA